MNILKIPQAKDWGIFRIYRKVIFDFPFLYIINDYKLRL